ncbi:MAG: UbiD family decarboxylase [Deltaproteobacteria bacterium]|nr:UbiD family decarboxylase [Deltaproteobacteria bacterium]
MGYKNLAACVADLERHKMLKRIECELDPHLEIAAVQRRVCRAGGPALLFTRVKGCHFPMLGNLFGTLERTRFIFRDALRDIELLTSLKLNPLLLWRHPGRLRHLPAALRHLFPRTVGSGPVVARETLIERLPQLKSWPDDAGAFVTLPQVYSEDPERPGWRFSNLGMYRVQLSGGKYQVNHEVGLHYQLHRGIGLHHAAARRQGLPLKVNIIVGGPPALAVAAVMPLPDGMPELAFAGLLGGRSLTLVRPEGSLPIPAEADFCICGTIIDDKLLPEGPFGDHLGYYSLSHYFPVLRVDRVFHRPGAIWPFTVVGRPPQEDTVFGAFIHELTGTLIPSVLPGVAGVHAVDAAGVHPLLLALGSERYLPYQKREEPRELLTQANAILGQGQLSLAKYLLIAAQEDNPRLDLKDIAAFFRHLLERVDWRRDLHFQTRTTIDTLDYSGSGLNQGSKVVIAAVGDKRRDLLKEWPSAWCLAAGFSEPRLVLPGIAVIEGPGCREESRSQARAAMDRLVRTLAENPQVEGLPLLVVVDDSEFAARTLSNFLWVTFTRSDPALDIYGVGGRTVDKHWGCRGPLLLDARHKIQHAPFLVEDLESRERIERLAVKGGPLQGLF